MASPEPIPLSIVIPTRNDPRLADTLRQLVETAPEADIIVVDDASDPPVIAPPDTIGHVRVFRCDDRIGCSPARTFGVQKAWYDWLLFTDGHMDFPEDWWERVQAHLRVAPANRVLCSTFVDLGTDGDLLHPQSITAGADLLLLGTSRLNSRNVEFIEVLPRAPILVCEDATQIEVPAVFGAAYFVRKPWFAHIGGLVGPQHWGCEEFLLSVKTWLCGGSVAVMSDVGIGHFSQRNLPRHVDFTTIVRNKIVTAWLLFGTEFYQQLTTKLPSIPGLKQIFWQIEHHDAGWIAAERGQLVRKYTRGLAWLADRWSVSLNLLTWDSSEQKS